jgi:gliding motility-associated-like protein
MTVTNVQTSCDASDKVIITFDITGGDVANYAITGITGGSFAAGVYTSVPLAENTTHNFGVEDGTSCNYVTGLSLTKSCSCLETADLTIKTSAKTDTALCTGSTVDLEITLANGGPYNFDIYKDGSLDQGFTNEATGTVTHNVNAAGVYTIANFVGGCTGSSGGTITVTTKTATAITTDPTATTICDGAALNLSATAQGDNLTYQWKQGTTNIGTDAATYSVTNTVKTTDEGNYTLEVTGDCGTETSAIALVTINATTSDLTGTITGGVNICDNATGAYSVTAATGTNVKYTWTVTGDATLGTPSDQNSINITFGTQSSYTVQVTPTGDCGTGLGKTLTVTNSGAVTPSVVLTQIPASACEGDVVTIKAAVTGGGTTPTFVWTTTAVNNNSTSDTLSLTSIVAGETVSLIMTSNLACATQPTASDNLITTADKQPSTANIVELSQKICATNITLNADPITTGTGVWSMNQTVGSNGSLSTTTGTSTVLSLDKTEVVDVTYTVSNGSCIASDETITIERVGDISPTSFTVLDNGTNTPLSITSNEVVLCTTGSYTLQGSAYDNTTETVAWAADNGNITITNGTSQNSAVSGLIAGTVDVTYTISSTVGSCSQDATLTLKITGAPSALNQTITGKATVCEKDKVTYTLGTPLTSGIAEKYVWTLPDGTTDTTTLATLDIDYATMTTSGNLTVTPINSCGAGVTSNALAITVKSYLIPTIAIQGTQTTVCVGETVDLSITSQINTGTSPSYLWSTGATTNITTVTPIAGSNTYTLTVTPSLEMCNRNSITSNTFAVTGEILSIDFTTDTYCENTAATLTATTQGTGTVEWYDGTTLLNTGKTLNLTGAQMINPLSITATYVPTIYCPSATGLTQAKTLTIVKKEAVTFDIADISLCIEDLPQVITIVTPTSLSGSTVEWTRTNIGGSQSTVVQTSGMTYQAQSAGEYTARVYYGGLSTCFADTMVSIDAIKVTVDAIATTFSPNPVEINTDLTLSAVVTPASGSYTYDWTFDKENGDKDVATRNTAISTYTTSVEGKHLITLRATETTLGCFDEKEIGVVTVYAPVLIPNVFTPNGDGEGDVWEVSGMKSFESTIRIYNRWGNLVFESFKYRSPWNGTYKGKDSPVGTYYYIIEITDPLYDGDQREYQGQIQILR